ncbi:hypothetical protein BGZ65_004530, partial [Modicella reniformis]
MYPSRNGPQDVVNVLDLALGYDTSKENGISTLSPYARMTTLSLENSHVPKISYYIEVSSKVE